MILKDATTGKQRLLSKWWLLLPALLLALLLWRWLASRAPSSGEGPSVILCDAEYLKGNKFVTGEHRFERGHLQSNEQAFSGNFSCKVPAGEGMQYGFSYLLDATPGAYYTLSVWRFHSEAGANSRLVVQSENNELYMASAVPVEHRDNGWARLEIRLLVPKSEPKPQLNVYVYTDGLHPAFFDDLRIERIDLTSTEGFEVEVLNLQIEERHLAKLTEKRAEALKKGLLMTDDDDWVRARLYSTNSDQPLEVSIRLKGDYLDHLSGNKWSFRVKVGDDGAWRNMLTFSLQTPKARHFLHEWVLHKLWEKEGVLTTRYDFVELQLNGKSLGVYAYEEHFEKQLLESSGRREGPILRLDESGFWAGTQRQLDEKGSVNNELKQSVVLPETADIRPFSEGKTAKDPVLQTQYTQALSLLEQLRSGSRAASEIFDLERLAKYYAILDLMGAYHGAIWHNQRFYYNPNIGKLEPIGFDGFGGPPPKRYSFLGQGLTHPDKLEATNIFATCFLDTTFVSHYLHYLWTYSQEEYLSGFLNEIGLPLELRQAFLRTEFEYQFDAEAWLQELRGIRTLLLPYAEHSLKTAVLETLPGRKRIEVRNTHTLPVEVTGYSTTRNGPIQTLPNTLYLTAFSPREAWLQIQADSLQRLHPLDQIRRLAAQAARHQARVLNEELILPASAAYLHFRLPGVDSMFVSPISSWPAPVEQTASQAFFNKLQLPASLPFTVNNKQISLPAGEYTCRSPITIPDGYELLLAPGTTIDLLEGAFLFSRSPVRAIGQEALPIWIRSSDASSQGLHLVQAPGESVFRQVVFDGLGTLNQGGWSLTGAVSFYETKVRFSQCVFKNNHSEDGLHLMRSDFDMEQCQVLNAFSDGLDADFSRGEIRDSRFAYTGNDGVDFSGSVVQLKNCVFEHNGDKGISAGEASDITLFDAVVRHSNIALASKDESVVLVESIRMESCTQGFTAYQKKPEYGPAHIIVRQHEAVDVLRLYVLFDGCTLQLGDRMAN